MTTRRCAPRALTAPELAAFCADWDACIAEAQRDLTITALLWDINAALDGNPVAVPAAHGTGTAAAPADDVLFPAGH